MKTTDKGKDKKSGSRTVEGFIRLENGAPSLNGSIYLRIIDVSRADAMSKTVAEEVLKDVSPAEEQSQQINFSIRFDPERRKKYDLFVHIDVDGDGRISKGDYITAVSYPIDPYKPPSPMEIRVERIG